MINARLHPLVVVVALAWGAAPALAQSTADKAKPAESIAGKAAAAKAAPARTAVPRKRYEFTAGAAAAPAQTLAPSTRSAAPGAAGESADCHGSKGNDA